MSINLFVQQDRIRLRRSVRCPGWIHSPHMQW